MALKAYASPFAFYKWAQTSTEHVHQVGRISPPRGHLFYSGQLTFVLDEYFLPERGM